MSQNKKNGTYFLKRSKISKTVQTECKTPQKSTNSIRQIKTTKTITPKNYQNQTMCQKLPKIKTKPEDRFKTQVSNVLDIFSVIQKQRQNAGLQPMCMSDEEQIAHLEPTKQIYYDADFTEVNKRIGDLKQNAYNRMQDIITATKQDKFLKRKFQQALLRYNRVRAEANQKIGKRAAMKAQKRLNDQVKQDIRKLQIWKQKTNQTFLQTKYY